MARSAHATASARGAADQSSDPVILCERLVRIFQTASLEVQALQGLDLRVEAGELTAVVGTSGSGKSTLLGILAGLDTPTAGSVRVAGHELAGLTNRERLVYRRSTVGFVWQRPSANLMPHLTAAENVALPLRFAGVPRHARRPRALELLDSMGVGHCRDRIPSQMSGGEQQRTAVAVALANTPAVILADEPTGELDSETAATVIDRLRAANVEHGAAVLVVTHDPGVASQMRRTIAIRDGRTATETLRESGTGHADPAGVEYVTVDRSGRLQLPRELTGPLGIRDRVRVTSEPGHIGVWPYRNGGAAPSDDDAKGHGDG
jgi:ABC-type lipoprotein export system ATPase subunit